MQEFQLARELAVYLRNEMDKYLGRELPLEFEQEFLSYCNDVKYKRMIFRGADFSATFFTVLRENRIKQLRKILDKTKF